MKKYSVIFCFLLATVFVGVPSFFAFAGEQGTLGDSQVDYVFEESTGTLTLTGTYAGLHPGESAAICRPPQPNPYGASGGGHYRAGGQSASSVDGCYGCAVAGELENHWQ